MPIIVPADKVVPQIAKASILSLANSHITRPRAFDIAPDNAISMRSSRVAHAAVMLPGCHLRGFTTK
jgi:hypothetical protein